MTEKLEIHVAGNLFDEQAVTIMYRHPEREKQYHFLDVVALEDIGVRVIDTGKYGYRFYDEDEHHFISADEVAKRLANEIKKVLEANNMPTDSLFGGVDRGSGAAEYHEETGG